MPYKFSIHRSDGLFKIVSRDSLSEALRSRRAYKKSPHFRRADISRIWYDPLPSLNISNELKDIAFIKKVK